MTHKYTSDIQIELPSEDPIYLIDVTVNWEHIGENYGEDADGRRGMWVEYNEIDDHTITKVQKYDEELNLSPAEVTPEIAKMVEDYMEKWEPEYEGPYGDEEPPDRDR